MSHKQKSKVASSVSHSDYVESGPRIQLNVGRNTYSDSNTEPKSKPSGARAAQPDGRVMHSSD